MSEQDYSKREVGLILHEIKGDLKDIKEQTTKTNGRVTALEKWMWMVTGGLAILSFLVGNKLLALGGLF